MEAIKKIDVHAHTHAFQQFIPPMTRGPKLMSPEELIAWYDRLNIEFGILQPVVAPEAQPVIISNENVIYTVQNYPDRFTWFCNVDARAVNNRPDCNLGYVIEHYKNMGSKGFGELTTHLPIDDPKMQNLFGYCQELDMPITIHVSTVWDGDYGIIDEVGLPKLEKLLQSFPKLKIIGHSQAFWREMGDNPIGSDGRIIGNYPTGKVKEGRIPELLRKYENLYADLSNDSGSRSLMRDREHAARFMAEFSDKLMYACDICSNVDQFMIPFDEFLTSMRESGELSEANYRKIVRENAIRILRLEDIASK